MRNERKLPTVLIREKEFVIDVAFAEIKQKDYVANRVSFNDMERRGEDYVFYIHPKLKGIYPEKIGGFEEELVGQMIKLDPEGICLKYGLTIDRLPKDDKDLRCDPDLIQQRLKGMLPKVDIAGQEYFADIRLGELRAVDDFTNRIVLDSLYMNQADNYLFFYDHSSKRIVEIDSDKVTKEPENTVLVELPNEAWLDPIASARKYGCHELELLDRYPLQHQLQARIYQLSETEVRRNIEKNLKKQQRSGLSDKATKQKARRRGKGL